MTLQPTSDPTSPARWLMWSQGGAGPWCRATASFIVNSVPERGFQQTPQSTCPAGLRAELPDPPGGSSIGQSVCVGATGSWVVAAKPQQLPLGSPNRAATACRKVRWCCPQQEAGQHGGSGWELEGGCCACSGPRGRPPQCSIWKVKGSGEWRGAHEAAGEERVRWLWTQLCTCQCPAALGPVWPQSHLRCHSAGLSTLCSTWALVGPRACHSLFVFLSTQNPPVSASQSTNMPSAHHLANILVHLSVFLDLTTSQVSGYHVCRRTRPLDPS